MALLTEEMERTQLLIEKLNEYDLDECIGCETGVDYIGAHQTDSGCYHPLCCTREAADERFNLVIKLAKDTIKNRQLVTR